MGKRRVPEISLGRNHTCGVDKWQPYSVKGKQRYRCGPCNRKSSRGSQQLLEEIRPALRLYRAAKKRARDAGVPFNLTVEDIEDAWPEDGKCPVLGMPLEQGHGIAQAGSPTLDQLNPALGYEPDNIAVISFAANRAKGNLRADELERLAAWMRAHSLS